MNKMPYNKKLYTSSDSAIDSSVIYDDTQSRLQSEINADVATINSKVGSATLNTTAQNLSGAINEHESDLNGAGGLASRMTTAETNIGTLTTNLNKAVLQASVQTITANGTTSNIALTGLTANHVVGNWGMFTNSACTTPISENTPTCDITITTAANAWSVTIANFSSTFYLRPTFILKQN